MSAQEKRLTATNVALLDEPVGPKVGPEPKRADSFNNVNCTQRDVALLGLWSPTKTKRFFRKHAEILTYEPAPGGKTGQRSLLPLSIFPLEIQNAYALAHPAANVFEFPAPKTTAEMERLASASDAARETAFRRREILDRWEAISKGLAGQKRTDVRRAFCARPDVAMSPATLYRLEQAAKNERIAGLLPKHGSRRGRSGLDGEIRDLVFAHAIQPRVPVAATWGYYQSLCEEFGIKPLSRATIYQFCRSKEVRDAKDARTKGLTTWMHANAPYITQTREGAYPGLLYVSDHKLCDNWVITPDGTDVVRPSLTGWQDYYSTMMVGRRLVITPNADSILTAFIDAVATFGAPDHVKMDNGKDFVSQGLRRLYAALNIGVHHAIPYNAKAKLIERLFRTMERFFTALPAYCGRDTKTRPETTQRIVDFTRRRIAEGGPLGEAHGTCCTWDEYLAHMDAWFAWYHEKHVTQAEGIAGKTPMQAWLAHSRQPHTVDQRDLAFLLMKSMTRNVKRNGIVELLNKRYRNYPALGDLVGAEVEVRYDPDDLSQVYVMDLSGRMICVAEPLTKVAPLDAPATEAALKELKRDLRTARKKVKAGREAEETIRSLTFEQRAGISPLRTPPQSPLAARPSVPTITKVSRAARELEDAAEQRAVANAFAPPSDATNTMLGAFLDIEARRGKTAREKIGQAVRTRPADVSKRTPNDRGERE